MTWNEANDADESGGGVEDGVVERTDHAKSQRDMDRT
jgi:hypothetical protein